jgi:hypothetical protein
LILNSGGGVSLIGGAETGASSGFYAQTTNWPATESPDLASPRIGLYPATSSKVLWASFQLSPSASGDWSGLALSFRHKVATGLAAPTHARAWISWYEGTTVRTRSSPVTALSATSTAWSTLSLVFSNGSTPLPSGAALAGKSFLVEWQCFGASATSNGLAVDDWTLQAGSLTGVQPLLIRTSSLAEARVGTAYQVSCSATGGMLPYAWSISSGSLPAGLSLNAATGVISGTPTAAGARSFSLRVTDATTVTATRTMSLNVLAANATLVLGNTVWADVNQNGLRESSEPGIPGVTVRLFASTADTATATPLASTLTGSGGLYAFRNLAPGNYRVVVTPTTTYSRTGGSPVALDNGIDNDNNGLQSGGPGTPVSSPVITLAAATEPGSTGRGNEDATIDFGLAPAENATLAVQPSTLVPAITGRYYSAVFSASGGVAPYSWSLTTGTLPAGLILQSTTGLISGTVTAPAGSYAFTVRAQDASGISGTRPVTLLVSSAQITISPATLPAGRVGSAYSQMLTANGGTAPYSWSISAGTLPTGLALNSSTGLISGTPVALAATGSAFSVQTTDAAGLRAFRTYVIALEGTQLTISPSSLPPATSGMAFSQAFTAAGGAAPYVWAVASGALPAGLSLNTSTGLLSGVLTAPSATYTFGIQATGANGSRGTATLTLSVNASQSLTLGNLVWADLNGNGLKDVTETGIAGVQMRLFPATANPATATPIVTTTTTSTGMYSFQVFSPGTYVVAFTPPAAYPAAASKVVTLDNGIDNDNNASQPGGPGTLVTSPPIALGTGTEPPGGGTGNADNTVDFGLVAAPVTTITISPPSLSAAMVGKPYQQALTAAGGTAPYTWAITSGTLPAGLTLNTATGMLSGTPMSISTSTFALRATDSTGVNASRSYTLGVACAPITLSPTTIPEFTVGTPATVALMASGGAAPYAWSVSGSTLPAGLTLNAATGLLSGTPTTAGTFTLSIRVTDVLGCTSTRSFALRMKSNAATIIINPATLASPGIGSPYQQALTATGGTAPYTWAVISGTLPAGLSLNTTNGILSGTPTIATTSTFTLRATDATTSSASRTYSLSVTSAPGTYPSSFLLWQQQNNLIGGPLDDPDADGVPNLLEYALGTPPAVCTGLDGRFALVKSNAPGTTPSTPAMHAELSRPGWPNDLVFVIEALGDLSSSPGGWMPVLRTPVLQTTSAGLIKRIWQNLNSATSTATGLLSPERGFIRLRVSLDADLNGTPEATAVTSTYGWLRSSPVAGISASLGMPFVLPAVYSSQILAVNGTSLVLGSMAGGMNTPLPGFSDQFSGGRQFYAEILTGAAEGRRFEIDEALTLAGRGTSASGTTLVLDLASPENTGAPIAALLTGSRVAIRPHWTLASAFDPAEFLTPPPLSSTAGTPAAFHRLNALNPDGTAYTTYLVTTSTSGPKWRNPADTTATAAAADLNGKPIRPDEGHILRVASTAPLTFTLLGQVRETAFARPLAATAQLLANPWPMPLTAAARALTSTSGFVPGASSTTADNIITFEGAIGVNTDLLRSYFLTGDTAAIQTWQPVNATDPALHFPPASAAFFRPLSPRPSWLQPRPWTP